MPAQLSCRARSHRKCSQASRGYLAIAAVGGPDVLVVEFVSCIAAHSFGQLLLRAKAIGPSRIQLPAKSRSARMIGTHHAVIPPRRDAALRKPDAAHRWRGYRSSMTNIGMAAPHEASEVGATAIVPRCAVRPLAWATSTTIGGDQPVRRHISIYVNV